MIERSKVGYCLTEVLHNNSLDIDYKYTTVRRSADQNDNVRMTRLGSLAHPFRTLFWTISKPAQTPSVYLQTQSQTFLLLFLPERQRRSKFFFTAKAICTYLLTYLLTTYRTLSSYTAARAVATGGISVYIPPNQSTLKFLCGCFVSLQWLVNIYTHPHQIPGSAPDSCI